MTSFSPLRIYFYRDGLVRFATEKYENTAASSSNMYIHLTNYSINKHNSKFISTDEDDSGSKWYLFYINLNYKQVLFIRSFTALLNYLRTNGRNVDQLMDQINDMIIKTMISIEPFVNAAVNMFVPYRGNCFELFGFDVLVDNNLKPWLLEVNLSPSMACETPIDLRIKSQLICDIYNMVGVELYEYNKTVRPLPRRR